MTRRARRRGPVVALAVMALILNAAGPLPALHQTQGSDLGPERIFLHDPSRMGSLDLLREAVGSVLSEDDPLRAPLLDDLAGSPVADQFVSETGVRAAGEAQALGLDVRGVVLSMGPASLRVEFWMTQRPSRFPAFFMIAVALPAPEGHRTDDWANLPDAAIILGLAGPDQHSLRARVRDGDERAIGGTIDVNDARVGVTLPVATVVGLGLARPGVQLVFRAVGPPPLSIYDRVPGRGSVQIGLPWRGEADLASVRIRVDTDGDQRDDLYYFDVNGNGLIDAAGRDRNGDGRIEFLRAEGPGRFVGRDGQPLEFPGVERTPRGGRQAYRLANRQGVYMTVVEDRNGDGDLNDAEEFRGFYIPAGKG